MSEHPVYPLTVHASCERSLLVHSRDEQDAFEQSHRDGCQADEFWETGEHFSSG